MARLFALVALLWSSFTNAALAETGSIAHVRGENLDLFYRDKILSGVIADTLVYVSPTSRLSIHGITVRFNQQGIERTADFEGREIEDNPYFYAGSLIAQDSTGQERTIFLGIDTLDDRRDEPSGKIAGVLAETPFTVIITANAKNNDQFVDPHFAVRVAYRSYDFSIQGASLSGLDAMKVAAAILPMLRLNGTL